MAIAVVVTVAVAVVVVVVVALVISLTRKTQQTWCIFSFRFSLVRV